MGCPQATVKLLRLWRGPFLDPLSLHGHPSNPIDGNAVTPNMQPMVRPVRRLRAPSFNSQPTKKAFIIAHVSRTLATLVLCHSVINSDRPIKLSSPALQFCSSLHSPLVVAGYIDCNPFLAVWKAVYIAVLDRKLGWWCDWHVDTDHG